MNCEGNYRKCGRPAVYRVEAKSHNEPVKHVCKTHISWALSHTAYGRGDIAEVRNIREEIR